MRYLLAYFSLVFLWACNENIPKAVTAPVEKNPFVKDSTAPLDTVKKDSVKPAPPDSQAPERDPKYGNFSVRFYDTLTVLPDTTVLKIHFENDYYSTVDSAVKAVEQAIGRPIEYVKPAPSILVTQRITTSLSKTELLKIQFLKEIRDIDLVRPLILPSNF